MLAIAAESIVKLLSLPGGRHLRHLLDVRRPGRAVQQGDEFARWPPSVLTREPPLATLLASTLLSFVAILLLPRQFHVAVVENNDEREIKRARWMFPIYLVLINLFVVPIAIAGLMTFPAGAGRRRHVRAGAAAAGRVERLHHPRVRRRPVRGDRHGDRRNRRARHHGVERHRGAVGAAAARGADHRPRGRRLAAAQGAAAGDLRHPAVRLPVLPLRRRQPARRHRHPGVCRDRAARAGVLRRPDLAARHRPRRHRRDDRRHPGLGLHAAAADLRRSLRPSSPTARGASTRCGRSICSGSTCRRWSTA